MNHPLYDLLRRLEQDGLHFTLSRNRDDSVLVTVTLVGERLEIDVFDDGHMEVSRFQGNEDVSGGTGLAYSILDENRAEEEKWAQKINLQATDNQG